MKNSKQTKFIMAAAFALGLGSTSLHASQLQEFSLKVPAVDYSEITEFQNEPLLSDIVNTIKSQYNEFTKTQAKRLEKDASLLTSSTLMGSGKNAILPELTQEAVATLFRIIYQGANNYFAKNGAEKYRKKFEDFVNQLKSNMADMPQLLTSMQSGIQWLSKPAIIKDVLESAESMDFSLLGSLQLMKHNKGNKERLINFTIQNMELKNNIDQTIAEIKSSRLTNKKNRYPFQLLNKYIEFVSVVTASLILILENRIPQLFDEKLKEVAGSPELTISDMPTTRTSRPSIKSTQPKKSLERRIRKLPAPRISPTTVAPQFMPTRGTPLEDIAE